MSNPNNSNTTSKQDDNAFECCGCIIIRQSTTGIVEKLGKFVRLLDPGCHCINPCLSRVAGVVSNRVCQVISKTDTKTLDNVTVTLSIAIQYQVNNCDVQDAFYSLRQPISQIESFIDDVVRGHVPKLTLDQLYASKEEISNVTKEYVSHEMTKYGYTILKALLVDIRPDAKVQSAMNEINAAQRLRMAAMETAEAEKIKVIKAAEATAESNRLHGEGVAKQRLAILSGYKDGIQNFAEALQVSSEEAIMTTMMTQYFDTLRDIGTSHNSKTSFISNSPNAVTDIYQNMRRAILEANTDLPNQAQTMK